MEPIYLDYNATAKLRPEALAAMTEALGAVGNPSAVHRFGRQARRRIEDSREAVAGLAGAQPRGVIFTGGGTEANNLALRGFAGRRVLVSAVEHPSILKAGADAVIPVDADGIVSLAALEALLAADPAPALVAVMLANNETGVIEPMAEVAEMAHRFGALVHGDAVQAAGKLALDIGALGLDSLSLSAHKFGGPQGVGALVLADPDADLESLLVGGAQESRHRAGTENVAGIAGFAAAIAAIEPGEKDRLADLRETMERSLLAERPDLVIFGSKVARLVNTTSLAVPDVPAQTLLMALDLAGIAVSAGSACSSGRLSASPVLLAMGQERLAGSAIRISTGWATTEAEIASFIERFLAAADKLSREHRAA